MSEEERIIEIEVERLQPFPNHPFRVNEDREMQQLIGSVRQYGISGSSIGS